MITLKLLERLIDSLKKEDGEFTTVNRVLLSEVYRELMLKMGSKAEPSVEQLTSLACDDDHLNMLVTLWAENTLVHQLAARLLAVREAQLVGVIRHVEIGGGKTGCHATLFNPLPAGTELFTSPPTPAVPEEPPAELLPKGTSLSACTRRGGVIDGWKACRGAMLQPVSQGYTLPEDNEALCHLAKSHGASIAWGFEEGEYQHILTFYPYQLRAMVSDVTDGKPITDNSPVIPDGCSTGSTYAAPAVPTDQLINIANHIAGSVDGLPIEWQDWASELVSDLRRLAASKIDPVVPGDAEFNAWVHGDYNRGVTLSCPVNLGIARSAWKGCCAAMLATVPDEIDIFVDQVCGNLPAGHQQ